MLEFILNRPLNRAQLHNRLRSGSAVAHAIMCNSDKIIIEAYASNGGEDLKRRAIAAHRRSTPLIGVRGNLHQRFMAEVDTDTPDLALREQYRKQLLEHWGH